MEKLLRKIKSLYWVLAHVNTIFHNNFQMLITYDKQKDNALSKLCDIYGSDKGEIREDGHPYAWKTHTYADFYNLLFYPNRTLVKRVFECGVGRVMNGASAAYLPGASLRVWRDYFPNADIVGADINEDVLFEEERIRTYRLDQTSPESIRAFWKNVGETAFDVILDDGLHTYDAGVCLFENSVEHLADNGYYIIEDVHIRNIKRFQQYFSGRNYSVNYVVLTRNDHRYGDNNIVVIKKVMP